MAAGGSVNEDAEGVGRGPRDDRQVELRDSGGGSDGDASEASARTRRPPTSRRLTMPASGVRSSRTPMRHSRCDAFSLLVLMLIVALISSSLAQVGWFSQSRSNRCSVHFAPYQFFDFGYFERELAPSGRVEMRYHCAFGILDCITPNFVFVMKGVIGASLLAIAAGVAAFLLELYIPSDCIESTAGASPTMKLLRRSRAPTSFMLLLMFVAFALAHFAGTLLKLEAERVDPHVPIVIKYEYGIWTLVTAIGAGAVAVCHGLVGQTRGCGRSRGRTRGRWQWTRVGGGSGRGGGGESLLDSEDETPPPSYAEVVGHDDVEPSPPPYEP